jgi:hypothetical protein
MADLTSAPRARTLAVPARNTPGILTGADDLERLIPLLQAQVGRGGEAWARKVQHRACRCCCRAVARVGRRMLRCACLPACLRWPRANVKMEKIFSRAPPSRPAQDHDIAFREMLTANRSQAQGLEFVASQTSADASGAQARPPRAPPALHVPRRRRCPQHTQLAHALCPAHLSRSFTSRSCAGDCGVCTHQPRVGVRRGHGGLAGQTRARSHPRRDLRVQRPAAS